MTRGLPLARQHVIPVLGLLGVAGVAFLNAAKWRAESQLIQDQQAPGPVDLPERPPVTALVAAWNEADNIVAHIQSFLALKYPKIELVICAGGPDGTFLSARRYAGPCVQVIEQHPGEGKQQALARCFQHATGQIVYLTDADCLFSDDALERLLRPIVSDHELAVTGTSHPLPNQQNSLLVNHLWARDLAATRRTGEYSSGILGRNAAVHRDAIDAIGGLAFEAPTGTDYHLAKRLLAAGIQIRHVPESSIASAYPASVGDYRSRQSRWLRNLLLFGSQYGAREDIIATGKTMALGAAMTTLPILGLIAGRLVWMVWAIMLAHATLARLRQMLFVSRVRNQPFPGTYAIAVLALTMVDFVVCALPIFDLIDSRKRRAW